MTKLAVRIVFALGMIVLLAPLAIVFVNAFNADRLLSGWGGFTFHWFTDVLSDPTVGTAALGSLEIALAATLGSAILGTLTVGFARYAPRTLGRITESLTITRIMMPEIVIAASLTIFVPLIGLTFGNVAVIIGHIVWGTAFFISIAGARRAGFDYRLEEAAQDLGASPLRVFRTITIPDLLPGLIAGALLAFTFSFDDVVTTLFLAGPNTATLPLEILSRIRHGINPSINAIGVLVTLVTVICLGGAAAIGGSAGGVALPRAQKKEVES
jgi:ABC-type spermidine/putrescine transport system permease subunit II